MITANNQKVNTSKQKFLLGKKNLRLGLRFSRRKYFRLGAVGKVGKKRTAKSEAATDGGRRLIERDAK